MSTLNNDSSDYRVNTDARSATYLDLSKAASVKSLDGPDHKAQEAYKSVSFGEETVSTPRSAKHFRRTSLGQGSPKIKRIVESGQIISPKREMTSSSSSSDSLFSSALSPISSSSSNSSISDSKPRKLAPIAAKAERALELADGQGQSLMFFLLSMHPGGMEQDKESLHVVSPHDLLLTFKSIASLDDLLTTAYGALNLLKATSTEENEVLQTHQQLIIVKFLTNLLTSGLYAKELNKKSETETQGEGIKRPIDIVKKMIIPFVKQHPSQSINTYVHEMISTVERKETSLDRLSSSIMTKNTEDRASLSVKEGVSALLTEAFQTKDLKVLSHIAKKLATDLRCVAKETLKAILISDFFTNKADLTIPTNWDHYCEQIDFLKQFVEHTIITGVLGNSDKLTADKIYKRIQLFAQVAKECVALNDYQSAYGIFAALNTSSVERLMKANGSYRKNVPEHLITTLAELDNFFTMSSNFKNLRAALENANQNNRFHIYPSFLLSKDLLFAKEGSGTLSGKMAMTASIVGKLRDCQLFANSEEAKIETPKTDLRHVLLRFQLMPQASLDLDALSKDLRNHMFPKSS